MKKKRSSSERAISLLDALRSVLIRADDFYNHRTALHVLDTVKRILINRVRADRRKKQARKPQPQPRRPRVARPRS